MILHNFFCRKKKIKKYYHVLDNIKEKIYNLGKNPFGIRSYLGNYPFGKLSVWEIIIWEKIHLGKYPTAVSNKDFFAF